MEKPDLNVPAGDIDSVKAAVFNGADAIYLGCKLFNARRLASNFKIEEIKDIIIFAHLNNVKVYLTLNTLVRDDEIGLWFKVLNDAYLSGIDGVIIQEIFFAHYIKSFFPGLPIHASTQASLMNYHGINSFGDIDLVVLARELSYDEIGKIRQNTSKKLEIFVHGHLCISYSGQCLISSFIGKRSGNRGICASSCRKNYNNKGYLISPKDLMLAEHLDKILSLGINTIKIEGRMKNSHYVALTTKLYRKQLDALPNIKKINDKEYNDVKANFNREFTTGFFIGNKSIIGSEMPMNRGLMLGKINMNKLFLKHDLQIGDGIGFSHPWDKKRLYGFVLRKLLLNGRMITFARKGESVEIPTKHFKNGSIVFLTSRKEKGIEFHEKNIVYNIKLFGHINTPLEVQFDENIIKSGYILTKAVKNELRKLDLIKVLGKSKRLGLEWNIAEFNVNDNVFMPFSELNKLRIELETKLAERVNPKRSSKLCKIEFKKNESSEIKPKLIVKVYTLDQLMEANNMKPYAIYYDIFNKDIKKAKSMCTNSKFFLDTPVILNDEDILMIETILDDIKPDGLCIGNLGLIDTHFQGEKHGKYSLNIFNDISLNSLRDKGILPMVSPELSFGQIAKLNDKNFIYFAHGNIPVMHFKGIYKEKSLRDEKGYVFPLRIVNNNTEMLYSRPIAIFEKITELITHGVMFYLLDLRKDTSRLIKAYQNITDGIDQDISMLKKGTTIGNFNKGVA